MDLPVVIFIGYSGCGKGTQSALLMDHSTLYLQTGKLFRDLSEQNSLTGNLVKQYLSTGRRLPDFLAVWNWGRVLVEQIANYQRILLDGAPRSLTEAQALDSAFDFYQLQPRTIFFLKVSREWATDRLRERGRDDDLNLADIARRLDWFEESVAPALDFFRDHPAYRFVELDGERPIEVIHEEILQFLNDHHQN